jgi:hypothetical protein
MSFSLRPFVLLLPLLVISPGVIGCSGEEPPLSPEQIEEQRQQAIRQSESFHQGK